MGSWGAGFYSSDDATDLRPLISAVLKLPIEIEDALQIVQSEAEWDPANPDMPLIIADQLEKRGIVHRPAFDAAAQIIEAGRDIAYLKALGLGPNELNARQKGNAALVARLRNPRHQSPRKTLKTPQKAAVIEGEYYCFPIQDGSAKNPYLRERQDTFVADGWGLVQIHDVGWAYGYLNWIKVLPLRWGQHRPPTFQDAKRAPHLGKVGFGTLSTAHKNRMEMRLLGRDTPRDDAPEPELPGRPNYAAVHDISICNVLRGLSSPETLSQRVKALWRRG